MSEPQLTNDDDALGADRSLLIVEDDRPFLTRLARAMESRGFAVDTAESVEEALALLRGAEQRRDEAASRMDALLMELGYAR